MTNALLQQGHLQLQHEEFLLTNRGKAFFKNLEIDYAALSKSRRHFAKPCLDWTEREYHLSGSLGKAMLDYFVNNRIILHSKNKPRVMILTTKGKLWLQQQLQIQTL